jgi:hypothetical protein
MRRRPTSKWTLVDALLPTCLPTSINKLYPAQKAALSSYVLASPNWGNPSRSVSR